MTRIASTLVMSFLAGFLTTTLQAQDEKPIWKDPARGTEARVQDLLSRLTLEEKVAQMQCIWQGKALVTDADGKFSPEKATASGVFKHGLGRIERPADGHGARSEAAFCNAVQQYVRDHTRLGIPVLFHNEALHGLQGAQSTSFPQAITLASAWDPELVRRVFEATAREVRSRGAHQVLAPVVDVSREPRWGRFEETYSEDPYLTARLGVAAVKGFQGNTSPDVARIDDRHVIATLKHMAGHGQPESGTNVGPANYSERTMREVFFYPFETAVREGGALSLMPSYNEVDGVPSHGNDWMLKDVLRGEWGFNGTIVSDWNAIIQLKNLHHVAEDDAVAAQRALRAGVDIELPDRETFLTLVDQVRNGTVDEAAIDTTVARLLRAKFMLGLFENPFVDPDVAEKTSRLPEHVALALEAAQKSIILLKNEGNLLPLSKQAYRNIAVIGPHAAETLLGGYSGRPWKTVSVLEGIRAKVGPGVTVHYSEGTRITEDSSFTSDAQPLVGGERSQMRWSADRVVFATPESNAARIREAVATAQKSDLIVLVLGENEMVSREAYAANHLGDRTNLDLIGNQNELLAAIRATGKPIVLLLLHGRPLAIPDVVDAVPAILDGWYLGQETGTAVADALFGDINPGGKLTVTFPREVGQLPVFYNAKPSARRGYVTDTTEPLFPFGFGLSYTSFQYGPPVLERAAIARDGSTTVSVTVTNTGSRAGDEIVQMYVHDLVSAVTRPLLELKGFERISLKPGESRTVRFAITPEALQYFGPGMKRVVEPGAFDVLVGPNARDLQSVTLVVNE